MLRSARLAPIAAAALALVLTAATPAPRAADRIADHVAYRAYFGPPWISIEYPANPLDGTSRGAFLLVHTFHHGTPVTVSVTGRAERGDMSQAGGAPIPLTFTPTSRQGVFALRRTWPAEGRWILVITTGPEHGSATAVVGIADGEVRSVRVPTQMRDGWPIPREVTTADLNDVRRALARG